MADEKAVQDARPADEATQGTEQQKTGDVPVERWYPTIKSDSADYLDDERQITYQDGEPMFTDADREAVKPGSDQEGSDGGEAVPGPEAD